MREPHPGISAARNRGIAVATGEIIAFTDDDVVVDRRWLRALGERFARQPDVSAVTGLVVPLELETAAQVLFEQSGSGLDRGFVPLTFECACRFRSTPSGVVRNGKRPLALPDRRTRSRLEHGVSYVCAACRGGFNEALGVAPRHAAARIWRCSSSYSRPASARLRARCDYPTHPPCDPRGAGAPDPWVWRGLHRDADRCYLARSAHVIGLAAVIPAWLRSLHDASSAKNAHRQEDHPQALRVRAARPAYRGVPLPTLTPRPGASTMRSPYSYKVADREYGSLMTATAPQALGLVFWVNVGAGTLVIADEAMTEDCAFDPLYVGVPAGRLR